MGDRSVRQQIVLDEIAGKNAAIHAYDHIIWVIRSGYLTLFFAGWALILRGLIETTKPEASIEHYIPMMLVISVGLTIGGLVIDLNYVLRKFRVIASLNQLMEFAFRHGDTLDGLGTEEVDLLTTLRVAGDAGISPFGTSKGLHTAVIASLVVYLTPFVCLIAIGKIGGF